MPSSMTSGCSSETSRLKIGFSQIDRPTPIERKGEVLTALSEFWFEKLQHVVANHLLESDVDAMPPAVQRHAQTLIGRAMLVRRAEVFPVECVVRGYLVGSGWKDYLRTGSVCGHK